MCIGALGAAARSFLRLPPASGSLQLGGAAPSARLDVLAAAPAATGEPHGHAATAGPHFLSVLILALGAGAGLRGRAGPARPRRENGPRPGDFHAVRPRPADRQCLRCHGGEKIRSGLDLSTREGLLKGGDKGLVVVPGKAKDSRLYQYVAHLDKPHMPPKEDRLPDEPSPSSPPGSTCGAPMTSRSSPRPARQEADAGDRRGPPILGVSASRKSGRAGRQGRGLAANAHRLASSWRSWRRRG